MASAPFLRFLFYCCFLQVNCGSTSSNEETTTDILTSTTVPTATTSASVATILTTTAIPTITTTTDAPTTSTPTTTAPTTEALPGMPTKLNYTAQTTSVNITWDSPENYIYNVTYQSSSGDPKVIIACPNISVEYCNIGGLSPGTSYIITVTSKLSVNAQKTSSSSITATTKPFLKSCEVQTTSESSMNLSWSQATSTLNVTYYYKIVNQPQIYNAGTSLSASVKELDPGTKYNFSVWAYSGSSNSESVTCSESTKPAKPLLLSISPFNSTSVVANWDPGTKANGNFTAVYVCGNYAVQSKTLNLSVTSFVLDNVQPGCNCIVTINVTSYGKQNASDSSSIVTDPLMNSQHCMISVISNNSLSLSWMPASTCLPFKYYYTNNTSSGTAGPYEMPSTSTQTLVTGLRSGTAYNFSVYAQLDGTNNQSNIINCINSTDPDTPTISLLRFTETSVVIGYSTGSTNTISKITIFYSNVTSVYNKPVTSPSNYTLTGLQPGCNYTLYLSVQSYDKTKASNSLTIITVPAMASESCRVDALTIRNTSMNVSWDLALASVRVVYTVQYNTSTLITGNYETTSASITSLTPGTMYLFQVWASVTGNSSIQSRKIQCSGSTEPGIPKVIAVSNITTSSMQIDWSTSGTNVINLMTVNYTCGNNQQMQTATANWIVLSDLKPACNNSFCITILSYDKMATVCSSDVTHAVVPTFLGICNTTTSSFHITWEFGLTNAFGSTNLSYCDVTHSLDCLELAVDNSTSVTLTNLFSATNYTLTLKVYSFGNVTTSSPAWAVTKPNLTGVCTVKFRNTTRMRLSWPMPNKSVALTYKVSYPKITLDSSSSSAPNTSMNFSAEPYLVENLLAGATYRFWVLALPSGATNSISWSPDSPPLASDEITCIDTTDPYQPTILTHTATSNSITVTISRPSNTVNVSWYIANITSSPGVSPEYHLSLKVNSTGTDQEVNFPKLAAASSYVIKVTSVVYGECGQPVNCRYESQEPAQQVITTKIDLFKLLCLAIIIPACVIIILLIIIIVVCLCKRKRKKTTKTPGETGHKDENRKSIFDILEGNKDKKNQGPSKPVDVAKFPEHVEELEKDSGLLYTEDYEDLKPIGRDQSMSCSELEHNRTKNRYGNIKPYDVSRVKLLPVEDEDGADYINASWMPGFNSKREFIATQGPLPCTKDDFWRMIWEYNCRGIVMLTNCIEKGKNKCDYYWPQDMEPVVYGDIQISITKEELTEHWNIRQLSISMGQQQKSVVHLHYHVWPDMDVPSDPATLLQFVRLVRAKLSKRGGPITVHCSAGVGRTGTYIALDTLLHQLDRQGIIDVYGVVYKLRLNRLCMVQTESQYVFLYRSMLYELEHRSNDNAALEEDDMYANFNGGQKANSEDEMYANFGGGPKKKVEDDTYANFRGAPTNSVAEVDGKFFFSGPPTS